MHHCRRYDASEESNARVVRRSHDGEKDRQRRYQPNRPRTHRGSGEEALPEGHPTVATPPHRSGHLPGQRARLCACRWLMNCRRVVVAPQTNPASAATAGDRSATRRTDLPRRRRDTAKALHRLAGRRPAAVRVCGETWLRDRGLGGWANPAGYDSRPGRASSGRLCGRRLSHRRGG